MKSYRYEVLFFYEELLEIDSELERKSLLLLMMFLILWEI